MLNQLLNPIYKGIGFFLAWMDSWAGNYLLVLLIFAVLVEILMLPLGIKQQKNSIKQARLRPKEMAIRKKYAGRTDAVTQQKMQTEIQELYRKENFNQFAGCLPMLIQLPIILILYQVVIYPLEYVVQLAPSTIEGLKNIFASSLSGAQTGSIKLVSLVTDAYGKFGIDYFAQRGLGAAEMADLESHITHFPDFNVLGINLGETPGLRWEILLLVPILTGVISFLSMRLTRKFTYQPAVAGDKQTGCSNWMMDITMPLFSAWIAFRVPAAIGIYWMFKSIIGTVKQFILHKAMPLPVVTDEDIKKAEKELKGKGGTPAPEERDLEAKPDGYRRHHEEDDDDAPYPTFVGAKGGRYDDTPGERDDDEPTDAEKEQNLLKDRLDSAPIKDDGKEEEEEKKDKKDN